MPKGKLIVFDGGNGAGKSTVLAAVGQHLQDRGIAFITTREPGGTPIGEKIRDILLNRETPEMSEITELLLFAAARAQHVQEKILPALDNGITVISDRFDSATLSFQHYARGMALELVKNVNSIALQGITPNLTVVLDLDPRTGLERVALRGTAFDRMELTKIDFLERARLGYLAQAKADPDHFTVLDASLPLPLVITKAVEEVDRILRD